MTARLRALLCGAAVLVGVASFGGIALAQLAPVEPAAPAAPVVATPDPTAVVARVNGRPITEADLAAMRADYGDALLDLTPAEQREAMIEAVINLWLMVEAGQAMALDQTPEFAAQMERLRQRAVQNMYVIAAIDATITEEVVRARYDAEVALLNLPEEIHAAHILVNTEAEATEIIRLAAGGADFAELARTRSIDPAAAAEAGDLGFFARGVMIQEFEDAAFAIEPGTVGLVPVQTQFGWHVIKVIEKRTQPPPDYAENFELIRGIIFRELYEQRSAELRAVAAVEILPPPLPFEGIQLPVLGTPPAPIEIPPVTPPAETPPVTPPAELPPVTPPAEAPPVTPAPAPAP